MARRKQCDPFRYTTNMDPATAVRPNSSGNLHGLEITDDDLGLGDLPTAAAQPLPARIEAALAASEPEPRLAQITTLVPAVRSVPAVVASSLPSPSEDGHRITNAHAALTFVLAGNAYFTLRSAKTGTRFTYRVSAAKHEGTCNWCHSNPCRCPQAYFVSVLAGSDNESDYQYMGLIKDRMFRRTKNGRITETAPSFKAFNWSFTRLVAGQMPAELEFWHEGRCGRCGRKLTVPESIAAGIGPECAQYMGAN